MQFHNWNDQIDSVMRGVASADKGDSAITNPSHAETQGVLYKECRTLRKRSNTRRMESITLPPSVRELLI